MATHLVLDIGNSRTKAGLFEQGRLVRRASFENGNAAAVHALIGTASVARVGVGSVAADTVAVEALRGLDLPVTTLRGDSPAPLVNGYATPATLGVDRLANAVGARALFPDRPVLAIDLGSCVTYDLVDAEGVFRGGIISPGLHMRAKAMHTFSARLPLVEVPEEPVFIGDSTTSCLASGAHHGLHAELAGLIGRCRQQHPGLVVVLTGGDAPRFARALENGIFAHPFLTLLGLHALLLHAHPPTGPDGRDRDQRQRDGADQG